MIEEKCFCCRLLPEDREWLERAWRAANTKKNGDYPVVEIRPRHKQFPQIFMVHRKQVVDLRS